MPALIRKMHGAKVRGDAEVVVWDTGILRREFLHSDNMADACLMLMRLRDEQFVARLEKHQPPIINIGCGEDLTVRKLALTVARVVGFDGDLIINSRIPDGTPRRLLDTRRLAALGWRPEVPLTKDTLKTLRGYLESTTAHVA